MKQAYNEKEMEKGKDILGQIQPFSWLDCPYEMIIHIHKYATPEMCELEISWARIIG